MNKEIISKKINYFYDKNTKVHVKMYNKIFYNGHILSVEDEVFRFEDQVSGIIDIFVDEVYDIITYIDK